MRPPQNQFRTDLANDQNESSWPIDERHPNNIAEIDSGVEYLRDQTSISQLDIQMQITPHTCIEMYGDFLIKANLGKCVYFGI